jgi:[protein-PII] uridylyltransferase
MINAEGLVADRFRVLRGALVADERLSAAQRRASLTDLTDGWLAGHFRSVPNGAADGMALVAVGGYGRAELLPGSDIDVVLVHGDGGDPASVANHVFYPIWDAGLALDHAVRTPAEARELAHTDLKVALGLIDARHISGDEQLTERLRADVRTDWRQQAATRLPDLAAMCRQRADRVGELAHLLEPDLVEAHGGLRDTIALRAVAASWVADRPHTRATDEAREWLLVVRDALHRTTRRRQDRLLFHDQGDVAAAVGLVGPDALLRKVAEAGRAIGHASDLTWRQADRALGARVSRSTRGGVRTKRRTIGAGSGSAAGTTVPRRPLAAGVVEYEGEVVLAQGARPEVDPVLPLRAAAAAAQAGLVLAPDVVERLAGGCPALPEPWPDAARHALVSLLGAGRPLVPVWDSLEFAGLVSRWLPEWDRVRYRATRTPVHRHTVERHLVETAVVASGLTRRVTRPDLLLLAALFHDLGKGLPGNHSETGELIAGEIGLRIGLPAGDAARLSLLVRHHLLLPEVATRRDPDDPATADAVIKAVGDTETLDLLAALTEADATAAGPIAWSPLRAQLVGELVARVRPALEGDALPTPTLEEARTPKPDEARAPKAERLEPWQERLAGEAEFAVRIGAPSADEAFSVTVVAPDRSGLVAAVAGVLAVHRLQARTATIETIGDRAVLVWTVMTEFGDPPREETLREDVRRALDGRLDVAERLKARLAERRGRTIRHAEPRVALLPEASAAATVVEVRTHDEPALLYRLAGAIAECGVSIRSAVVETLGAEAVDVFYLVDSTGAALRADEAARVTAALSSIL